MIFNRKKWNDIDWCDQNVKAATLSDVEVVEAASRVHPYSTALIDLLDEACRRRLAAVVPIARKHVPHPDPFASTSAVGLLQDLGDASDVPMLLALVSDAIDHFHLAAILNAIVTLDPSRADYALVTASRGRDDEYFDDDYVMASVIVRLSKVLPNDSSGLERRLLDWAVDSRLSPTQRESVFRRLSAFPRTQRIEDFLVEFCVRDDGANPNLTNIVDDALHMRT